MGLFLFTGPGRAGSPDGLEWRPTPGPPHRTVPAWARRPPFRAGLGPDPKKRLSGELPGCELHRQYNLNRQFSYFWQLSVMIDWNGGFNLIMMAVYPMETGPYANFGNSNQDYGTTIQ